MAQRRKRFQRKAYGRPYKKLFIVSAEGAKTEPKYFDLLNKQQDSTHIKCLKGSGNSPSDVLRRMEKFLAGKGPGGFDEVWLVVDRDKWSKTQLDKLHNWAKKSGNRGFALSNPKFEYWLLLHFEDGNNIRSPQNCDNRLKKHIPDYNKDICIEKFSIEAINKAIARGKERDRPPCPDWPTNIGCTTVYRLVERIFRA